jgi:SH3 domain-containing YSC84-like protein 1
MKKAVLICLLASFGFAPVRAHAADRASLVTEVDTCEAILQEFMSDPAHAIPPEVRSQAKAILIVNQFKAGFIFGVKGGYGVIMVKRQGHWSIPALLSASEASLGPQIGAKSVETIYIITDETTPKMLFREHFSVGVDAKAVIGPLAAESERDTHSALAAAPVLVYSKSVGLFAGATVKAGTISRDDDANFLLYNTSYTLPELLYSDWVAPVPEVRELMAYVQQLFP